MWKSLVEKTTGGSKNPLYEEAIREVGPRELPRIFHMTRSWILQGLNLSVEGHFFSQMIAKYLLQILYHRKESKTCDGPVFY
jgi:hypothetical protein